MSPTHLIAWLTIVIVPEANYSAKHIGSADEPDWRFFQRKLQKWHSIMAPPFAQFERILLQ